MIELGLYGVKKYMDATMVLKDISFQVYDGEKAGIVGVNGSGKSTILKLIAGVETLNRHDSGWISLTGGSKVAYLEQIPSYPDSYRNIDILETGFDEVNGLEAEMRQLEDLMKQLEGRELDRILRRYSDLQQRYEARGGYEKEEKMSKVCQGLKLEDSFLEKEFSTLSGGEKTTVMLGKMLLESPDVLLLDEPTNHLDVESIEWLEKYLKSYNGMVLTVSHDRYFLDNTVTKIIEIEDMECKTYKGNYSEFARQKEENLRLQYEHFKEQQKEIKAIEDTIKELRDWATRADNNKFFRRAASLQIKLSKIEKIEKPVFERKNMRLNINMTDRSGNEVIKAENMCKAYEDKVIFNQANLMIRYGDRTALIGPNGSGKTTLLRMLLGEEAPDGGSIALGASVKTAYLPQHITFENEELTVVDYFRSDIDMPEGKAREYLSRFMFFGNTVFKRIRHLSGGEKIRLKLSKLLYEDINLLVLDEPTNHLDIDSIETLEAALESFEGTVFFISHDRYFIKKLAERIVAIENKQLKVYDGDYEYYLNKKNEAAVQVVENKTLKKEKAPKITVKEKSISVEAQISKVEEKINSLESEINDLEQQMLSLGSNYEELNKLHLQQQELKNQLDEALEEWNRLDEELLRNKQSL